MSIAPALQRTPLVISAGTLVAGPVNASFREGDPGSLLHSYLVLVRQLRGQQRAPSITLRQADISALANYLGSSEDRVLDDLLERMGATRAQRKAIGAMFAVGALTIVATGSISLELASAGVAAEGVVGATAAVEIVQQSPLVTIADKIAPAPPEVVVETTTPPSVVAAPTAWPAAELAIAGEGADWDVVVALHLLTRALAEQASDRSVSPPTEVQGRADDGATAAGTTAAGTTAAGTPPVSPAESEGVADDGSIVAEAAPPVLPTEGVGVTDDGSIVAVGTPPVPPTEGVGVADDGSIVAVGTPPVPPTTSP